MLVVWGTAEAQQVTASSATPVNLTTRPVSPSGSQLGSYYHQLEARLVSEGNLRQDRRPRGVRFSADDLASNFMQIAMRSEYSLRGGSISSGGQASPLRRWVQPVRLGVRFGASVDAGQQRADLATIRQVAHRLETASGHAVALTANSPNFHVLIVSDAERSGLGPLLRQLVPGISRAAVNAVTGMGRNTFCMAVAVPNRDQSQGYDQAIAIVRAEHPPLMRQSCIEEELAQGMGLANDSPRVRPSIFNDDEEFGVLTRHDELLLQMLYHPSLQPGMAPYQVERLLPAIARQVAARG
ncbi:DUF2927 domain-containing protein [Rhodophyticola sp. CCM32]|uniref:DUF2927 domain-containing protein n=1 Tax=Rhodophyticola sp. CCM32 TaxID=2916397 RepID=UPI00143D6A3B|nr:DUF2927 domain-containing protein [Rhodophyticola sp. CCM32]